MLKYKKLEFKFMLNYDLLEIPSQHFLESNDRKIEYIIIHCIAGETINWPIKTLDEYGASTNFLIPHASAELTLEHLSLNQTLKHPKNSPVIEMVNANKIAYHAGASEWKGIQRLSKNSIGIELHAPGYANNDGSDWYKFSSFSKIQINTLLDLLKELTTQYNIDPKNILGHSDISPYRLDANGNIIVGKTDPGALFPWNILQEHGFGIPFHKDEKIDTSNFKSLHDVQQKLVNIGYTTCPVTFSEHEGFDLTDTKTEYVVRAFKMHFMGDKFNFETSHLIDEEMLQILGSIEV